MAEPLHAQPTESGFPGVPEQSDAALDRAPRWFWSVLAGILLLGLIGRLLLIRSYVAANPLAQALIGDAATYWDWAGRIAAGQLTEKVPFFSAPLYPYFLGLVRALGGTLTTVYVVQAVMDLTTAVLLACTARTRWSAGTGLIAAALFLVLEDAASFTLRVLSCSLHLLLVAWVWSQLVAAQRQLSIQRGITLGVALGLLCLAYPPALLLVLVVGPWLVWQFGLSARVVARAAVPVAVALLCVAPATWHNWRASGAFFPIQALSSVTLRLGNAPGASGTYTEIPELSRDRQAMCADAARICSRATGASCSWRETDDYFRRLVWDDWRAQPAAAVKLAGRKLYWFLTGRHYGDLYQPTGEKLYGLTPGLGTAAPLATAWLIGPGLVGLGLLLRRPVRHAPEWALFVLPLAIVVGFWYSPRYRIPAVPTLVVAAAWALAQAFQWRKHWVAAVAVVLASGLAVALVRANEAAGFDRVQSRGIAMALIKKERFAEAERILRPLWEQRPESASAASDIGYVLQKQGRIEDALRYFTQAIALNPDNLDIRWMYAECLLHAAKWSEAVDSLSLYVAQRPDELEAQYDLGIALASLRRYDEARTHLEQAERKDPRHAEVLYALGLVHARQGHVDDAVKYLNRALEVAPNHAKARRELERLTRGAPGG